jgi:hypothetical protein
MPEPGPLFQLPLQESAVLSSRAPAVGEASSPLPLFFPLRQETTKWTCPTLPIRVVLVVRLPVAGGARRLGVAAP